MITTGLSNMLRKISLSLGVSKKPICRRPYYFLIILNTKFKAYDSPILDLVKRLNRCKILAMRGVI